MTIQADRKIQFDVPSAIEEIPKATRKLLDFLGTLSLSKSVLFDLRLSFEEILINAMKHGNQFQKDVPVVVEAAHNDNEIYIGVSDQGMGFSCQDVKDPTQQDNLEAYGGRGVYLVKHLMDSLTYCAEKKQVQIKKKI